MLRLERINVGENFAYVAMLDWKNSATAFEQSFFFFNLKVALISIILLIFSLKVAC